MVAIIPNDEWAYNEYNLLARRLKIADRSQLFPGYAPDGKRGHAGVTKHRFQDYDDRWHEVYPSSVEWNYTDERWEGMFYVPVDPPPLKDWEARSYYAFKGKDQTYPTIIDIHVKFEGSKGFTRPGYDTEAGCDQAMDTQILMPVDAAKNKWNGNLGSVTRTNGFLTYPHHAIYDHYVFWGQLTAIFAVYASAEPNLKLDNGWRDLTCTNNEPVTEGPPDPEDP